MRLRFRELAITQTALGIMFWDTAAGRPVTGGLLVRGRLLNAARTEAVGREHVARLTRSGVYAFFGLHPDERRLPPVEQRPGVTPTIAPLAARRAVINVTDLERRFLPASFEVALPLRGAFRGRGVWLARPLMLPAPAAGDERGVGLWSAPTRQAPAGLTVLTASLALGGAAEPPPAPYALVRVEDDRGRLLAAGLADEGGALTLPLPYPAIPDPPGDDPAPPLGSQVFALTVRVAYGAAQPRLPGGDAPNLVDLLGQPPARIARERAANGTLTLGDTLAAGLRYEQPLVLRTAVAGTDRFEGVLRIVAT